MRVSLFIDESGDFSTESGEWVVTGLLVPCDWSTATQQLDSLLRDFPQSQGVRSQQDFHLTDLRKDRGHDFVRNMCIEFFSRVLDPKSSRIAVAAVNRYKLALSSRALTYRQMLLDLLALAETAISGEVQIMGLDLVLSTVRDEQRRVTTTHAQIREEVLQGLAAAAEVGLASRGLAEIVSLGGVRTHFVQASNNWGTIAADFLANLIYNRRHPDSSQVLSQFEKNAKLRVFQSFGGVTERRARVAERNGDLLTAGFEWSKLSAKDDILREEQRKAMDRILSRLLHDRGTTGARGTLEVLIEMFQRAGDRVPLGDRYEALRRIEDAVEQMKCSLSPGLRFRLRNYMLLTANHLTDAAEASRLLVAQDQIFAELVGDPDEFPRVLEYLVYRVSEAVNRLALDEALHRARRHEALARSYRAVWELLQTESGSAGRDAFGTSRLWLRARSSVLWASVLGLHSDEQDAADLIIAEADDLMDAATHRQDRDRLSGYKTSALLRTGRYDEALAVARMGARTGGEFALFWNARAANDWVLAGGGSGGENLKEVADQLERYAGGGGLVMRHHPQELLIREAALCHFLLGRDSKRCAGWMRSSIAWLEQNQRWSPINTWQTSLARMHADFVGGKVMPLQSYLPEQGSGQNCSPPVMAGFERLLSLSPRVASRVADAHSPLLLTRRVSPY